MMRFDFLRASTQPRVPFPHGPVSTWKGHPDGDPYLGPLAFRPGAARRWLEELLAFEGQEIQLTTASPRVLADLDLLRELDARHTVAITLALAAADLELARRVDPLGPDPRAVLSAAARLAAEGLTTRLLCRPLLPGVNTLERTLRPLFEAARTLGVHDVIADSAAKTELLGPFARLRLAYGFPQRLPGRG